MSDTVRFVHTADLHLDAPFQGIEASDERVRRELVEATYAAFERIVDIAIDRAADFVLIAGDVYNSRDKSLRAQLRFQSAAERLAKASIDVYVAQGNHDPANGWSAGLELPESVRYFPVDRVGRFEIVRDGELRCTVYGRGYGVRAVTENLARTFRRDASDPLAIGVLHANVGGNTDYEPYAPCSLEDLRDAGMDYWALGHIHKPGQLATSPEIVYAGSPQGLNPKEDGPHGCYLVELSANGVQSEFVDVASVVWHRVELDLSSCSDVGSTRQRVIEACERLSAEAGRPAVVRVDLVGRCAAHNDLARPGSLEDLLEDVRAEQLAEEPWLWVDRIRNLTGAPIDVDRIREGADFAADLVRTADSLVADPDETTALLGALVSPVATTLGGYEPADDPAALIERARDVCLDLLLAEEDER